MCTISRPVYSRRPPNLSKISYSWRESGFYFLKFGAPPFPMAFPLSIGHQSSLQAFQSRSVAWHRDRIQVRSLSGSSYSHPYRNSYGKSLLRPSRLMGKLLISPHKIEPSVAGVLLNQISSRPLQTPHQAPYHRLAVL